jgi:hypothetical protein
MSSYFKLDYTKQGTWERGVLKCKCVCMRACTCNVVCGVLCAVCQCIYERRHMQWNSQALLQAKQKQIPFQTTTWPVISEALLNASICKLYQQMGSNSDPACCRQHRGKRNVSHFSLRHTQPNRQPIKPSKRTLLLTNQKYWSLSNTALKYSSPQLQLKEYRRISKNHVQHKLRFSTKRSYYWDRLYCSTFT